MAWILPHLVSPVEFSLRAADLDPTCLVVAAWIVFAVGLALFYVSWPE